MPDGTRYTLTYVNLPFYLTHNDDFFNIFYKMKLPVKSNKLNIHAEYKSIIAFLSITACFIYLLSATWLQWGHPIYDTFREFWVPLQLLKGKILYKEIFYEYGFFPPYFIAFLFSMFGVHITTLVGCGIGITLIYIFILYKLARFFLDEFISCLVVVTFLFVFAFGYDNYSDIFNFILPYSFASIFCLLFISSALYYFIKFIFYEKKIYFLLWSLFLSFAFLSRIEMTLLVWGGFACVFGLFIVKNKDRKKWGWAIYLFIPLAVCFLGYFIFLFSAQAFDGFKECIVDYIFALRKDYFIKEMMGTNNLPKNILMLLFSFGIQVSIVLLIGILSTEISPFFINDEKSKLVLMFRIILLFFLFILTKKYLRAFIQFRCIPLILIIGITFFLTNILRSYEVKKNISLLTIFLISFLMVIRVLFIVIPNWYGFYLATLGLIGYYYFFYEIIPKVFTCLSPRYSISFSKPLFSFLLACFFISLAFSHWCITRNHYKLKNLEIKTDRGNIFYRNDKQTMRYREIIGYLKENTSRDDTLVVLPEGIGINFFSQRDNPTRYYAFIPPRIKLIGEEKIIDQFEETNIDYILIVKRETPEYGFPHFGVDYGKKIDLWIKNHYMLEKLFGPYPFTGPEFSGALYRKK